MLIQNRLRQCIWDRNVFTVYHECEIILSFLPSYFPVVVVRHHDQGNLTEEFIWGLHFQHPCHHGREHGSRKAGIMLEQYPRAIDQQARLRELAGNEWTFEKTSKPNTGTSPSPSQTAPPM